MLHIVCFVDRVCLVSAKIKFGFVFFRCTHFKDAIKHLLNSEPNQIFGEVGYLCLDLCLMLVVTVSVAVVLVARLEQFLHSWQRALLVVVVAFLTDLEVLQTLAFALMQIMTASLAKWLVSIVG